MKKGKAAGADQIPSDLLHSGGEDCAAWLHEVFCRVWTEEVVPADWSQAVVIPIYKKGNKEDCNNYRGIALLSVPGKAFARLLLNRIRPTIEDRLAENQCGFRAKRSAAGQVFILRQLIEKSHEFQRPLFVAFIDLQKAYDTINREALWAVLERYSLPPKIIALIKAMHASSSACVRAFGDVSGSFEIHNGVRQGCILSPTLFIIFLDFVLRQMPTERKAGIQIAYRFHNNLINT